MLTYYNCIQSRTPVYPTAGKKKKITAWVLHRFNQPYFKIAENKNVTP